MSCPRCDAPVQPGQRFCAQCGARLERACAACGQPLPPEARFCPACGTAAPGTAATGSDAGRASGRAADAAGAAPEAVAERRLVSVLFCDLVGFTSATEERDAEETRELLTAYYDLARERVERYGGTIEKFIGDAVMAVWGVPVAHEDDAERAVRAALDMVAAVPQAQTGLAARAAVVSGEAAVTLGAEGQGMVAGDLVNTASRLQGHAEPGTVLVGEATWSATARAIAYEEAGSAALRGKAEQVAAWRAVRVRAGIGGRFGSDELEPPFVGRDAELRMLTEMFHATARESRLRLVSVTGQAGIGKSRLSRELEVYLDGIRQTVYWHRGRCPSYGEGLTYWAVGEMVRRRAGIAETDTPERTAELLGLMLDEFVTEAGERARVEPALRALVGLDTRGWSGTETGELYAAWRTLFERIAEQAPVVLVFEDVQWADAGLVGFIEHLLEWSRTRPILVVTLARPEFLEDHPTWGAGLRNFSSLHLEPLPADAIVEMLDGAVPGLPVAASRRIAARAEGVPLYAVETLRMLLAQGVLVHDRSSGVIRLVGELADVAIPDSLRGLVAARLDLLPPAERALVQDAAVLGHSFIAAALAAVTGVDEESLLPSLRELVRRELLRVEADPRSPERGQYMWVQAVLREVAYATLSRRDRCERHLAAARYFDTLGDEESAGVVADHYLEAWRSASGPDEAVALGGQARVALRAASDRAERLRNYVQAASFVGHSLELTDDEAERAAMLERCGDLLARGGAVQKAERRYREALASLPGEAPDDDLARVTAKVAAEVIMDLRIEEAIGFLEAAVARLGPALDGPGRVMLEGQLGRAYFLAQRVDVAETALRRTIETAERVGPEEALVEAIISLGSVGIYDGRMSALAMLFGSVDLARRAGLVRAELRALNNLAAWAGIADPALARELEQRILQLCDRAGYATIHLDVERPISLVPAEGLEAAEQLAADVAERVEPGSREESTLAQVRLSLAGLAGDWERWEAARAQVESESDRNPESADWREFATAVGLCLQGRQAEAAEVVAGSTGMSTTRLVPLIALLRGDAAAVEAGLLALGSTPTMVGPYELGVRATGEAGLRLMAGLERPALERYGEGVDRLRESEIIEVWTLGVVALIGLVGPDHDEVRRVEGELRGELGRIGAAGALEALDRALAAAPGGRGVTAPGMRVAADHDQAASRSR